MNEAWLLRRVNGGIGDEKEVKEEEKEEKEENGPRIEIAVPGITLVDRTTVLGGRISPKFSISEYRVTQMRSRRNETRSYVCVRARDTMTVT